MSGTKKAFDLSEEFLETFLSTINGEGEKEIVRQIVKRFVDCGLPVKTKQYHMACMQGYFRILCFVKKSYEAVIINNKGMGRDGMSIQIRIDDRSTFDRIDGFSPNIKNQILNARSCGFCSSKCEGKKYIFTHQGSEYVKCHIFSNNFFFENVGKDDICSIMDIVNGEIGRGSEKR